MILQWFLGILVALVIALPLAWKWQLGVRRVGWFVALTGLICGAALTLLVTTLSEFVAMLAVATITLTASTVYLAYRFYRDPERTTPSVRGSVISPADGIVVYIKRSEQGRLPIATKHEYQCPITELLKTPFYSSEVWLIGISMNLLDVHVNRAPIAGTVMFHRHFPGKFHSLRLSEGILENERATTIFEAGDIQVAIVQIASRLVRQIVSYVKVGEQVALGQRIGAIRFGSQVDLILPARENLNMTARVGDKVTAGETILAAYVERTHKPAREYTPPKSSAASRQA